MRRAFLVKSANNISPLERTWADLRLGNTSMAAYRQEALRENGWVDLQTSEINEEIDGPALVLGDDVFFSKRALKSFCRLIARSSSSKVQALVLPHSRQTELFSPLQDVDECAAGLLYPVRFLPAGQTARAGDLLASTDCEKTVLPYREILVPQKIPRFILGSSSRELTVPLTSTVVMRVRHWLNVLRLAHVWPQIQLIEHAQRHWVKTVWHLAAGFSFNAHRRTANYYDRFCYVERSALIHPTATVEASILGKNVTVGAYANVVGSVLGDGVTVEERANLNYCVLGGDTFVSKNSTVVASVAFGPTDVCVNGIQYAVIDEGCGLTSWARPLDARPDGPVKVKDGDRLREAGVLPCGVAFGRGSYVGANVLIAPGRVLPPKTVLLPKKEDVFLG